MSFQPWRPIHHNKLESHDSFKVFGADSIKLCLLHLKKKLRLRSRKSNVQEDASSFCYEVFHCFLLQFALLAQSSECLLAVRVALTSLFVGRGEVHCRKYSSTNNGKQCHCRCSSTGSIGKGVDLLDLKSLYSWTE